MSYRILYVFVEGPDDERFFNSVFAPHLKKYQGFKYISFAEKKPIDTAKFLKTIRKKADWGFLFLHDFDDHPCVTSCKEKVCEKYSQVLNPEDIAVVKKEIESGYLAGLSKNDRIRFGIKPVPSTQNISKEQFNQLIPKDSVRTDFMIELLKGFSVEEAKKCNQSLAYFLRKHIEES